MIFGRGRRTLDIQDGAVGSLERMSRALPRLQSGKRRKKKGRISSTLLFLLMFLLFLVVFGGLCLWAVVKINEERSNLSSSSVGSTIQTVPFGEGDVRNLLLVTIDASTPQGFVVLRTDPANTRMRTLALPRETEVAKGTELVQLAELYQSSGGRGVAEAVGKQLGLTFNNYAVIDYDGLEKMITYLENGVIFRLPEDIDYQSPDGSFRLQLEGGPRTLTAAQAVNLLRYPNWNGGRQQRADFQAQLVAAILNQYMVENRMQRLEADFTRFVNLTKMSDIRVSDFNSGREGLEYLVKRNTGAICTAVSLPGEYVGSGDGVRFAMADDVNRQLGAAFGDS